MSILKNDIIILKTGRHRRFQDLIIAAVFRPSPENTVPGSLIDLAGRRKHPGGAGRRLENELRLLLSRERCRNSQSILKSNFSAGSGHGLQNELASIGENEPAQQEICTGNREKLAAREDSGDGSENLSLPYGAAVARKPIDYLHARSCPPEAFGQRKRRAGARL